jgi:hypothetical protein
MRHGRSLFLQFACHEGAAARATYRRNRSRREEVRERCRRLEKYLQNTGKSCAEIRAVEPRVPRPSRRSN